MVITLRCLSQAKSSLANKNMCHINELKFARVVPILKSGDSESLSIYRPVSILSLFAKTFEKLLYKYLINFLNINDII